MAQDSLAQDRARRSAGGLWWFWLLLAVGVMAAGWLFFQPSSRSPGRMVIEHFSPAKSVAMLGNFPSPKDRNVLCGSVTVQLMANVWMHNRRFIADAGMQTVMVDPDGSGTPWHQAFNEKWSHYCDRS
jgi:hypothetical protein